MMKIPHHKNLLSNLERFPAKHGEHPCCVCGKPVKRPFKLAVHEHNGGGYIVTEEEAAALARNADLGLQPIGSDCLRKHPELKPYVQRLA